MGTNNGSVAKSVVDGTAESHQEMQCQSQRTTNIQTVVFVTKSRQPNQELPLSFIDVNAKPKVKLEAVKCGYKQRQCREIGRQWHG